MKHYTLMGIVNKGQAQGLMAAARKAGAPGGTIVLAKGTATSSVLAMLGIGDSRKEILLCVISKEDKNKILDAISSVEKTKGVVALLDCYRDLDDAEDEEMEENKWTMIEVICADGMSDDIMATARKAGAKGGTVISGRGTGTEEDVKFFGVPLVPEKEVLMIIADNERAQAVYNAISGMETLKKKGMGILFALPVRDFKNLG